jgi:hypothetical protein
MRAHSGCRCRRGRQRERVRDLRRRRAAPKGAADTYACAIREAARGCLHAPPCTSRRRAMCQPLRAVARRQRPAPADNRTGADKQTLATHKRTNPYERDRHANALTPARTGDWWKQMHRPAWSLGAVKDALAHRRRHSHTHAQNSHPGLPEDVAHESSDPPPHLPP